MNNKSIRFIVEVGVFAAMGLVLDFLAGLYSGSIWTAGGSLSIAMVPIFIMSFKWGLKGGLSTGLIIGTVQILLASGSSLVHPLQVILDYSLAFSLVGLSGIFFKKIRNKDNPSYYITMGVLIGGILRTISHILSGYIFFAMYTPEGFNAMGWSIVYNSSFMIPSVMLCLILLLQINKRAPHLMDPLN